MLKWQRGETVYRGFLGEFQRSKLREAADLWRIGRYGNGRGNRPDEWCADRYGGGRG
jgi:hypothetical protein